MEAAELVDKYAAKLVGAFNEVAPEAWAIMVQGQLGRGVRQLALAALWIAVFCACARVVKWGMKEASAKAGATDAFGDPGVFFSVALGGATALVAFVAAGSCLADAVLYLCSPEYMALRELLK